MPSPAGNTWGVHPNAPPAGTRLCPLDALSDDAAKGFEFGRGLNVFRMFIVKAEGRPVGYVNRCPHYSLPLNHRPDEFLTHDRTRIMCRQHLAIFSLADGACLDGACEGRALEAVDVHVDGDQMIVVS